MGLQLLFRVDAYAAGCDATVVAAEAPGVHLDRTVFYPQAGGQPGDTGVLRWAGGETPILNTVKGSAEGSILHLTPPEAPVPPPGTPVSAMLDWPRRHRHMRMHSALHLLCSLIPGAGVTGGQIGADRSRLDFDLPDPPMKDALTAALNALVAADHPIAEEWVLEAELDENPGLVRTLSVQPPRGTGLIRLVRIGAKEAPPIDLQPCGGTHVRATGEIGRVEVTKIESKGRQNRRVYLTLAGDGT
jgi:misacylated tRNA(Ala) deacylase